MCMHFLFVTIRATCHAHIILLDTITLIILGEPPHYVLGVSEGKFHHSCFYRLPCFSLQFNVSCFLSDVSIL
jgi:hypothetical protein